jgi:hypothetical protein
VVSAHLDGHASELELAAAERHMGGCHECCGFSNRAALMTAAVRTARTVEPIRQPVLVPARRHARSRRRRRVLAHGVGVAAVVTLALLVGDVRLDQPANPPRLDSQSSLVSFDLRPLQRLHQTQNVGLNGGSPVGPAPLGGLPQTSRVG